MDVIKEKHQTGNHVVTFRWHFTPGFETLLEQGVQRGWYDVDNTLQQ